MTICMKPYDTLIRLAKESLDLKRRELNRYLTQKDKLVERRKILEDSLTKEKQFAYEHPMDSRTLPYYEIMIEHKEETIDQEIKVVDNKAKSLSNQIAIAFSELKKYEIINEKKEKELLAEQARKEQIALDENRYD